VDGVSAPAIFNLTNIGPPATITALSSTVLTTTVNTAFTPQFQVVVKDVAGTVLPGVSVRFTAPFSSRIPSATGTFAGGSFIFTGTTDANGQLTAPVFTANTVASTSQYTVTAAIGSGVLPIATSFQLFNQPGAPAFIIAAAPLNRTVDVNTALSPSLSVTVTDNFSNPIPNAAVTFSAPVSTTPTTVTGTFANNGTGGTTPSATTTARTGNDGVATAVTFTANNKPGCGQAGYDVTASTPGITTIVTWRIINQAPSGCIG
jgi:adhesin/invasin